MKNRMGDGQWCCVSGCPSPHGEVYHSFPINQSRMNAWLKSIHGTEDVKEFNFRKARICSLHFSMENDYMGVVKQDLTEMKLLPDAVPSIFPWKDPQSFSSYKQYSSTCLCENCLKITEEEDSLVEKSSLKQLTEMPPPTAPCPRKKPRKSVGTVKVHPDRCATAASKDVTQQDESAQSRSEKSPTVTPPDESETAGGKKENKAGSVKI